MAGAKGWNDDCAAFIIFLVNTLLLITSLVALAFVIYIWVMQGDLVAGGQEALSVYVPEFMLVCAIIFLVVIFSISLLGITSTARQMKENKDKQDKKDGKGTDIDKLLEKDTKGKKGKKDGKNKNKKKGCCFNWGLGLYTFLCILGFALLFSLAVVAGVYSDKMTQFSSLNTAREQGDEWLTVLEEKMTSQVLTLADKYPQTWNQTQAVAGCCGWNVIEDTTTTTAAATDAAADNTETTADGGRRALDADDTTVAAAPFDASTVTAFTDSKCCQNADVITSVDIIGKVNFDFNGCRKDGAGQVYTCEGVIASYIQSNLVKCAVFCVVLAILQLTLAICACVVRNPLQLGKKGKGKEDKTKVTQVKPAEETRDDKDKVRNFESEMI